MSPEKLQVIKVKIRLGLLPSCPEYNLNQPDQLQEYLGIALRWAAIHGHLDTVKYLVSLGCDPRANDDLAIRWAIRNGHLDTVKYLVSIGCNIHADDDYAFKWAVRNGHTDVYNYLKSLN